MRALVVSTNRLVGLGMESVVSRLGVSVVVATLQEAVMLGSRVDLTFLYADRWEADSQHAGECLHANHMPFIAVTGVVPDEATRHRVVTSGALSVICADDTEMLASVFSNFEWMLADRSQRFTLDNGYIVDLAMRDVQREGRFLKLSGIECKLLALLRDEAQAKPAKPMPAPRILFAVYGSHADRTESTLRVSIYHLRGKIEVEPDKPGVLLCRPRHGYWLLLGKTAAVPHRVL